MKKPCNCDPAKRGGNHYSWCQSHEDMPEEPKEAPAEKVKKPCNCRPETRVNGTHYGWCESLQ